jgi:hypothetical protein
MARAAYYLVGAAGRAAERVASGYGQVEVGAVYGAAAVVDLDGDLAAVGANRDQRPEREARVGGAGVLVAVVGLAARGAGVRVLLAVAAVDPA